MKDARTRYLKVQTPPGTAAIAGDVRPASKIGRRSHARAQRNRREEPAGQLVAGPPTTAVSSDVNSRLRARRQQPGRRGGDRTENELGKGSRRRARQRAEQIPVATSVPRPVEADHRLVASILAGKLAIPAEEARGGEQDQPPAVAVRSRKWLNLPAPATVDRPQKALAGEPAVSRTDKRNLPPVRRKLGNDPPRSTAVGRAEDARVRARRLVLEHPRPTDIDLASGPQNIRSSRNSARGRDEDQECGRCAGNARERLHGATVLS